VSPRRVLVTGGSGFIGSALVKRLLRDGCAVRVLDDNSRGAPRRLAGIEKDIEFIAGDIRDPAAAANAVRGVHEVHHLAYVNGPIVTELYGGWQWTRRIGLFLAWHAFIIASWTRVRMWNHEG